MLSDDNVRKSEAIKFIGLVGSLALALAGQSDLLSPTGNKIVTIIGISATTIFSWLMHPPRSSTALERRTDYPEVFMPIPENISQLRSEQANK